MDALRSHAFTHSRAAARSFYHAPKSPSPHRRLKRTDAYAGGRRVASAPAGKQQQQAGEADHQQRQDHREDHASCRLLVLRAINPVPPPSSLQQIALVPTRSPWVLSVAVICCRWKPCPTRPATRRRRGAGCDYCMGLPAAAASCKLRAGSGPARPDTSPSCFRAVLGLHFRRWARFGPARKKFVLAQPELFKPEARRVRAGSARPGPTCRTSPVPGAGTEKLGKTSRPLHGKVAVHA